MQQQAPVYFKARGEPRSTPNPPKLKLKEWELEKQIGFGGTFGMWHMYSGRNKRTNAFGTIFVMEKKLVEKFVFGKADNLCKQFFNFISKDSAVPGKSAKEILIVQENVQEENNCLYYVTEPLVGTLSSMYKLFGHTCLNTIKRKADYEVLTNANPKIYSTNPFAYLLQYVQPDSIAYGYMTLLRSLSILQNDGYVFGNLTPANIAITPRGEWRPVGFACCLPGGINFEFSSDSGALTRPCAHFVSPSMLQNKKASKASDAFQLASCIYTIFGGRPCKYSSSSPCMQHMNTEELCEESAKMFGASLPTTTSVISPAAAAQNAATVPKWYEMTQSINTTEQVCLSQIEAAMPSLWAASREECDCSQMFTDFLSKSSIARVANEIMELKKEMVFTATTPMNSGDTNPIMERTVHFLTKMLPVCLEKRMLTVDLTMAAIWPRLISMLSRRDIYRYTIPLLIQYSYMLEIPADQLYILLEPIVIACTLTEYRSKFPGTHSTQQAWTSGIEVFGRLFMYQSPYMDIPMDKSTKERNKFIPNFDKQINVEQENSITAIICILLEYASFFTNKKVGARSHYNYLNFLVSCLSSKNALLYEKTLLAIANCAPFIGDVTNWMLDHARESLTITGITQQSDKGDSALTTHGEKYTQPIVKSLVPKIIALMSGTPTDALMGSCLRCLAVLIAYLGESDIADTVLPAIYKMVEAIIRSPKAIVFFAEFTQKVYARCTPRSIAMLFLPALLKGLYHPSLESAQDLEQIRKTCSDCFTIVDRDAYSRIQTFKPPTNASTNASASMNANADNSQQRTQYPEQAQIQHQPANDQYHGQAQQPAVISSEQMSQDYGAVANHNTVDNTNVTNVEGTGYGGWNQNNGGYGNYNAQGDGYGGDYNNGYGGYDGYNAYNTSGGYGGYDNTSGGYGGW